VVFVGFFFVVECFIDFGVGGFDVDVDDVVVGVDFVYELFCFGLVLGEDC